MRLELARVALGTSGIRAGAAGCGRGRAFRTTVLLAALSVLAAFDLAFTQSQLERGNFAELNLLATMVACGPAGMVTYKTTLFGVGALILYRYRRCWESEAGLWVLLACHLGLMAWWLAYLGVVETCLNDPAVVAPRVPF